MTEIGGIFFKSSRSWSLNLTQPSGLVVVKFSLGIIRSGPDISAAMIQRILFTSLFFKIFNNSVLVIPLLMPQILLNVADVTEVELSETRFFTARCLGGVMMPIQS